MDLAVMQTVRLKGGMADAKVVAAATGRSEDEAAAALAQLAEGEAVQERKGRFKVTREGRDELDAALAEERDALDTAAVAAIYDDFTPLNGEFKEIVHEWQMRDDEPNDHSDAEYDATVLDRLRALHERFVGVAEAAGAAAVRLAPYPGRFAHALEQVGDGDQRYLLSPMVDSYHQVWFELHEDLIGLSGRNREQEASEGRAD